jgi:hypothetical protein
VSLEVYIDDSGTHDPAGRQPGARVAFAGGFVGYKANWKRFSKQWHYALQQNNVEYFKYSELEKNRQHPEKEDSFYHGWPERKKHAFLKRLAKIAAHHSLSSVGGHIDTQKINELVVRGVARPHYIYKSAIDCMFKDVILTLNALNISRSEKIDFYFDDTTDPAWKAAIHESYTQFKEADKRVDSLFAGFGFKNDRDFIPLQAADLNAGVMRRLAIKFYEQQAPQEPDEIAKILTAKKPNSLLGINEHVILGPDLDKTL